jgi:hypothetical protein
MTNEQAIKMGSSKVGLKVASYEVYSIMDNSYVGVQKFNDLLEAYTFMSQQARAGKANKWQLNEVGKDYHHDCYIMKGVAGIIIDTSKMTPFAPKKKVEKEHAYELFSRLNGDYVGITSFNDMKSLQNHMALERKTGKANQWEITPRGKGYHLECEVGSDGQYNVRRFPPLPEVQ